MQKRIDVKPCRHSVVCQIATWTGRVFRRHHIRPHTKCVINATDGKWEGATAMRKRDAKFRKPLEHASENHRTDRERCFCRHGDQPRQPIFRHALAAQHVPWMNKDSSIEFFGSAPDRLKRGVIEVQSIYPSEIWIRINVRSDLSATQAKFADAALQFRCGEVGILHWNSSKTGEARWMIATHFGDVVV